MTASTRSRRALSAGSKSRMPRGGLTDATGLSFQVGLGGPDAVLQSAQPLAQSALGVPALGAREGDQAQQRLAELGLGGRCGFDPQPLPAANPRGLVETGVDDPGLDRIARSRRRLR